MISEKGIMCMIHFYVHGNGVRWVERKGCEGGAL